jgi:hypothetical protein
MIRSSYVVLALLGMTGLALAQQPPPDTAQPPPDESMQPPPPESMQPPPPEAMQPPPPEAMQPPPMAAERVKQNKLGLDAAFVLPVDEYADGVDAAFGLFGRLEFEIDPRLAVTARLGFLYHLVEDPGLGVDFSLVMFPVLGGIRYNLSSTGEGGFLGAELGINYIRVSVSGMGIDTSDSETKFTLNLGAGFRTGQLSFMGSLFLTPDVGDETNLVGLMATIGYDIAAL